MNPLLAGTVHQTVHPMLVTDQMMRPVLPFRPVPPHADHSPAWCFARGGPAFDSAVGFEAERESERD